MNLKEFASLIKVLKDSGVQYIKTQEFEIRMDSYVHNPVGEQLSLIPADETPGTFSEGFPPSQNEEEEIPHVVQELTSLLKLDDTQLVDRLFPQPNDEETEAE